jgi:hypothetical protein
MVRRNGMAKAISRKGKSLDGKAWAFTTFDSEEDASRLEEIFSNSDRVAVIVGNAYFEELLEELLRTFLVEDNKVLDNVFNPLQHGTLSTATAKIDIAYLLGLITKDTRDCLKSTAKLRNLFAHHSNIQSFASLVRAKIDKRILINFKKHARNFLAIDDTTKFKDDVQETTRLYHALLPSLEAEIKAAMLKTNRTRLVEQKTKHSHIVVRL